MSTALALLALVVALNPLRRRDEIEPVPRRSVALGGALVAGAVFVTVAALAETVLDELSVSEPNIRIAAGLVLGLRAVADLVSRPRVEVAAWPGARAALVPVAFPLLLRPEVAILALAVGADRGGAVAALVAAVAFSAAAAGLAGLPATPLVRHAGWTVSAVGVAVAVNLIVLGVLDI